MVIKNFFSKLNKGKAMDGPLIQSLIWITLIFVLFFALLPLIITFMNSLKTNFEYSMGVWSIPRTPRWENYLMGFRGMSRNMFNSIVVALIVTGAATFIGSVSAYIFVRHEFPGKNVLFAAIISVMVVPGVLTLTPSYLLIINLGLRNTWWAIILPMVSGTQVGTIFLFRTFIGQQPADLFEAAKIDGAGDFLMYRKIAMPLAIPVIAIQSVGIFSAVYNDFLWPMLVIDQDSKQMLMPVLKAFSQQVVGIFQNYGAIDAIYLMSGIPLIVTTVFSLRYFISGEFASGVKL